MARNLRIRRNTAKIALLAGIDRAIDELINARLTLQNGNSEKFFGHLDNAVTMVNLIEVGARGTQVDDLDEPTDEHGFVKEERIT